MGGVDGAEDDDVSDVDVSGDDDVEEGDGDDAVVCVADVPLGVDDDDVAAPVVREEVDDPPNSLLHNDRRSTSSTSPTSSVRSCIGSCAVHPDPPIRL